ncbi:aspartate--tRNA ligase [Treponema endosymbiont of Eucomonympha sp.]|uniref:aspartate--tRNA ligase n=1 Tax=Treponema endosymbiont of Eucomonympha sp. TaxID=1580831 RepID=UPI00075199F6|nr:aspartate--tRNA ligase [Treponema endosymbiont of Eucomonympha sp.]
MKRTVTCGALRKADEHKTVALNGWVHRKRDHGGISFISLRDRYGITQVVVDADAPAELAETAASLKMEYCVAAEGTVRRRPAAMVNPDMPTGEIEVAASKLAVLSKSETLPFMLDEVNKDGSPVVPGEDLRLKYRYLDLRTARMQHHLALRHTVALAARNFLSDNGFYEIETPTFIKSTPEGARDYLVPSRLYPGKFYALPQSPQLYKQLLMVSGFDRYFQIARCYRDEDARGDRQPEFTQIDMEMSFVSRDDVLDVTERMMQAVFKKALGSDLAAPFARIPYDDALDRFGTDKPDLRFEIELQNADFLGKDSGFRPFKEAYDAGGGIKALAVPGAAGAYSRKKIEELEETAKIYKAKGFAWIKVCGTENAPSLEGGIAKFFGGSADGSASDSPEAAAAARKICAAFGAAPGDLLLFASDAQKKAACTALGAVRGKLGKDLNLIDTEAFAFAWIIDFPLFEWNDDLHKWDAAHHLFSMPQERYIPTLEHDPGAVKGDLYDLVLNGCELASGSIRVHDPALQKRLFGIAGITEEDSERKFGFLTNAFKYGAPPHGGIAPGLDRLAMLMCRETSIKDVIAFPKNTFAVSPIDGCPSEADAAQLRELHLAFGG